MNSFGAYVASEATTSVPLDLTEAGTSATTAALALFDPAVVVVVAVEVELELLLLPQPANARTASAGTPILAISLLI
jgi:hypothetical protein